MSGKGTGKPDSPGSPSTPPGQPPSTPPGKKKVKIRKGKKWVEVDVDGEIKKGRFKYIKFVDYDGLDTYWISPE
jgi:hypothetical protein